MDIDKKDNITPQMSTKARNGKKGTSRKPNGTKKRVKANGRERLRMSDIRGGFKQLRKLIPGKYAPTFKYLSKIEILRFAMTYISELSEILQSDEVLDIDFSGKSYPLHKTSVEETALVTPPASEDDGENTIFRFDDNSISQLQSPTYYQIMDEGYQIDSVEYLRNIPGHLTPLVQSPQPGILSNTSWLDANEFHEGLEELLTPTWSQDETDFNLEDYLEEELCIPVIHCETEGDCNLRVYPDFSDLLTPTECDEILSQIA